MELSPGLHVHRLTQWCGDDTWRSEGRIFDSGEWLRGDDAWNIGSFLDDFSTGLAAAILVFALVVLTSPLAGVGVFFAEWMLVLLLVPIGVAYRLLFRRPWAIYAETADGHDLLLAQVVGWRESQEVIEAAAGEIKRAGAPQSPLWRQATRT